MHKQRDDLITDSALQRSLLYQDLISCSRCARARITYIHLIEHALSLEAFPCPSPSPSSARLCEIGPLSWNSLGT
jgi:hypothetical protein